ncbi:hypothetical protein AB1Y20_002368 [Prymnesium parvum]|uniref:H(+)-exporting diphosphatase n=1 Tax=Prymnesium parvum TaxID=97485 RepID=A0AB34J8B7_PRYPA
MSAAPAPNGSPPPSPDKPLPRAKKMNTGRALKELIIRRKPLKRVCREQPVHVVIMLLTLLGAVLTYLFFYSAMLVGSAGLFLTYAPWSTVVVALAAGMLLLAGLLIFDADGWHKRPCLGYSLGRVLQFLGVGIVAGLILLGALLSAESYPAYPLAVFVFFFPVLSMLLKHALFDNRYNSQDDQAEMNERAFALISLTYKIICVASIAAWIVWMNETGMWTFDAHTRERLHSTNQCNLTSADVADGVITCTAAFLLWVSPVILSAASLIFALFFSLIAVRARFDSGVANPVLHVVEFMLMICAFGVWCAASIAGAGMQLAHSVMAICGAGFFGLALVLLISLQSAGGEGQMALVTRKLHRIVMGSEWARALLVYCCTPLFFLYLAFSCVNQCARKLGAAFGRDNCLCKPPHGERGALEASGASGRLRVARAVLNARGAAVVELIYASERKTQVLVKTLWLALLAWGTLFGSTLTFIGLAWLISVLKTLNLGVVVLLFLLIGIVMFLIPIVPGLAVYLCGGILVVDVARSRLGDEDGSGFYLAIALTSGLCYFMKLLAHVLQQKLFGEALGSYVSIRSAVQINSELMRAIKYIVMQPGLTLSKVCILCGGPDWPTSVICGILRRSDPTSINTLQLLVGLTPMIFLIAPVVAAAAFQLRTADPGPYDSVATISLVSSTALQFAAFIGMTHYVSNVVAHKGDILKSYQTDEPVEAYEKAREARDAEMTRLTQLGRLPVFVRFALIGSTALLTVSSYGLMFFSSYCFEDFSLANDRIEDMCLYSGCDKVFAKPLGLIALAALCVGLLGWQVFNCWTSCCLRPSPPPRPPKQTLDEERL